MAAHLVMFDPNPDHSCSGNCCRMKDIAYAALASDCFRISTMHSWMDGAHQPDPTIVLLRLPAFLAFGEVLQTVRTTWKSAAILAALCNVPYSGTAAPDLLQNGLDDFFCCPFREIEFVARLRRLLVERSCIADAAPAVSAGNLRSDTLIGSSPVFLDAVRRIPPIANSTATVLISGETGVGKELFAHAIHYNGARRAGPFIPINCSALPDHLFENELFGHTKGAYTDADTSQRGLLAEADGGTLFLDEVDMLSPGSQAKLLRFLQDGEYRPLGSSKTLRSDVRAIVASNADLRERVAKRQFREDLFHRLNVLSLRIPSLRERMADILLLANHFLMRFAIQYHRNSLQLSRDALHKMLAYSWPGNVRELEGLLHRAVVLSTSDNIDASDIELPVEQSSLGTASGPGSRHHAMGELERCYLVDLLTQHHGNISHSAHASGTDRRTLQRLLRKHGIERLAFQKVS